LLAFLKLRKKWKEEGKQIKKQRKIKILLFVVCYLFLGSFNEDVSNVSFLEASKMIAKYTLAFSFQA
jgi:hypothetical protein